MILASACTLGCEGAGSALPGTTGGACRSFGGLACDPGLECVDGLCVANLPDAGDAVDADPDRSDAGSSTDASGPSADASVHDARPVDAPPVPIDAAPPLDACTDSVSQVLSNPMFDFGPGGGWIENASHNIVHSFPTLMILPHSGLFAAWLGGANSITDELYQDVAIPPGTTGMQISGFIQIDTQETTPNVAYDTATLSLRTTSGSLLESLITWSNLDENGAWTQFFVFPSGAHSGQTIRFHLTSTTDTSLYTSFYLDTLAFQVTVCQ